MSPSQDAEVGRELHCFGRGAQRAAGRQQGEKAYTASSTTNRTFYLNVSVRLARVSVGHYECFFMYNINAFECFQVSNLALAGNLFDEKKLNDVEGYENYMERYTAVRRKLD